MLSNTGEAVGSPTTRGEVLFSYLLLAAHVVHKLTVGRLHAIRTITVVCALVILHAYTARIVNSRVYTTNTSRNTTHIKLN